MNRKSIKRIYIWISFILASFLFIYSLIQEDAFSLGIVSYLANSIINLISAINYPGIVFLMALESACIPIPSEVIMPFSGYLSRVGQLDFLLVASAGTIGNLIGSLIAYYMGAVGGRLFIEKYGKYVFLGEEDLDRAEKWFNRYGGGAVLLSRIMPAVRTVISLPAGIGRMNLKKFATYTFLGSIPWNFLLTYLGFILGSKWVIVENLFQKLDLVLILILVLTAIYVVFLGKK